jgi:histidinol-phosphate/aromatic aminotransferase/cobyric acid decarboxylase-like protein
MHSLPLFVRLAGRPVALIGSGPAADAKRRLLERAGAAIVGEPDAVALAIVADGDEAATARLKARGVLVKHIAGLHPLLANCLRLTVGSPEENDAMIQALKASL